LLTGLNNFNRRPFVLTFNPGIQYSKHISLIMKTKLFLITMMLSGIYFQGHSQTNLNVIHKKTKTSGNPAQPQDYFTLKLIKGDTLANIYSRTIAFTGNDFTPVVFRVSGTSIYEVVDNNRSKPVFNETDLYDGRPESKGLSTIGLDGSARYNDQSFVNSSASGLLYSELVWGPVNKNIQEGDSWKNTISQPWELGGPGTQVIKVIAIDKKNQTLTLQREGSSEGFFDQDKKQIEILTKDEKKLKMDVTPGTAHWIGYTTFKNGVILSDELLVSRPVTLSKDSLHFVAKQREYILLNAMPHKAL
jgi:hypothetical protein